MAEAFDFSSYPAFKFRPDLAEEIGFVDALRAPLLIEEFAKSAKHLSDNALLLAYEDHCRAQSRLSPGRFFQMFGYCLQANDEPLCFFMGDGGRLRVPQEGLFFECMIRANVALGLSADGPYKIMPEVAGTVVRKPDRYILYDTCKALGYVVPWDVLRT
jgi:hypothetical protein